MSSVRKPFQRVVERAGHGTRRALPRLGAPLGSRSARAGRATAWLFAAFAASLLGGCPVFPDSNGCSYSSDCGPGFYCSTVTSRCELNIRCSTDKDCDYDQVCSRKYLCVNDCRIHGCTSRYTCVDADGTPECRLEGVGGGPAGGAGGASAGAPGSGGTPNLGGASTGGANLGGDGLGAAHPGGAAGTGG